jgi:hypothetical protein
MTINTELLDAYRFQRQRQNLHALGHFDSMQHASAYNAASALVDARRDVASGKRRYPSTGRFAAVSWDADKPGLAYVQSIDGAGLRLVGTVEPNGAFFSGDHTLGWYTDPYGDAARDGTGLCWGVVYQLPARNGKARFVAGYQFGGFDGGPTLDMSTIYLDAGGPYNGDPRDFDAAHDAARSADSMAQHAAEEERDYQAAWQAGSRYADCLTTAAGAKAALRALLIERRTAKSMWQAGAHLSTICDAIANKAQALLESMRDAVTEASKLKAGEVDPVYFWAGDERLAAAFNEGASASVLPC